MMIPTTLDRKTWKKWLLCPILAALLVLSCLPVYASGQQTEQTESTETPTVTQDTGSESAKESAASSEQKNQAPNESVDAEQNGLGQSENTVAATSLTETPPYEGQVLDGGYVGFKNKATGKYLTIPNGATSAGTNVCQQSESSVPNAQEFYLDYTHLPNKNVSYFTIYPVDASTGNAASTRVKSSAISSGTANVSLQYFMPTEMTDRWQIKHAYANYYYIYIANRPDATGTQYALTASGNQDGSTNGNPVTSPGNVYVSSFTMTNNYQLWEICADGKPIDINGVNMTDATSMYIALGQTTKYFYVPKKYNANYYWSSTVHADIDELGTAIGKKFGTATITLKELNSSGFIIGETSTSLSIMPSEGDYFISNTSTLDYIGSTIVWSGFPLEVGSVARNQYERWHICCDDAYLGYFTIQSAFNGLYIGTNPNGNNIQLYSTVNDNTLWRVEVGKRGNAVLRCKINEISNCVLTQSITGSTSSLTSAPYLLDNSYCDEWDIYPYNFNYSVCHYYDAGFDVRFPNDVNYIDEYQNVCTNVLLALFGVHTSVVIEDYVSCSDVCSSLPVTIGKTNEPCNCGTNINHKTRGQLRDDLIYQYGQGAPTTSRFAWTGHVLDSNRSNSSSYSHTVVMTLKQVYNNDYSTVRDDYIFTLLHETSHQLGAPDHYCYAPNEDEPCTNKNCWRCTKGISAPNCLMTSHTDWVEYKLYNHTLETLYCDYCKSSSGIQGIGTHLIDHHGAPN